ncbi:uncharacterized protein LOC125647466 [Ostrea edulis]|uniref:uncharacterized protein LOC125647466 n=1 Tax=Ostrea edulis TaxID=37623 RepID=UPI0024AEB836|nr:uncharacterized protein LOC125647466 [Ostrea edulis]
MPPDFDIPKCIELHHFSDASTNGYGQCSYIRTTNEENVHCALLFTNRVQMIRDVTDPCQWYYVDTSNNPVDHASRGLRATEIQKSSWLTGPVFLWQHQLETVSVDTELQLGDPEVRSARTLCTKVTSSPSIMDLLLKSRISSWTRMVSVTARLQRLSNGIKGTHPPTVEERQRAELTLVKLIQHSAFLDAVSAMRSSESLPSSNPIHPLDPVLQDVVLRVGGRLRNANISSAQKHPIILPKCNHFTRLILQHAHILVHHQGRGITHNKLGSLGYWIIGGSKAVADFIRQCVLCRKLRKPTEIQKMADLPKDRVEPTPPFTYCGMDCFGPFLLKNGRREAKRYGLLFTWMCSRAIHIEMLDDMSTDSFINGLRCFIAIRGAVRQIRSDQGSNFIGARNEFERELDKGKVVTFLAEGQWCDFVLNAPSSSHTGGVWERQIRTVRNILDSVLSLAPGRLDDASLRTLFYEVMSIVNCRPLSVSEIDNPDSLEPLTPNHILTGKITSPLPPPGEFVKEDLYIRKLWGRVQYLLEQFWSRWKREYLAQITLRQKWHGIRRNIQEGDIVLVKDVDLPRNQ